MHWRTFPSPTPLLPSLCLYMYRLTVRSPMTNAILLASRASKSSSTPHHIQTSYIHPPGIFKLFSAIPHPVITSLLPRPSQVVVPGGDLGGTLTWLHMVPSSFSLPLPTPNNTRTARLPPSAHPSFLVCHNSKRQGAHIAYCQQERCAIVVFFLPFSISYYEVTVRLCLKRI